ncbi:MAG TPA: hypothetical protein PKZ76_04500 [Xanthomonadaceae bacterium]|nr:hypothetical protein [Xanthomonadaceae bacterium]
MCSIRLGLAGLGLALSLAAQADPVSYEISVNTTPLAGQQGFVAFDFIDGDGQPGNVASIDGFASDAALVELVLIGDADGGLVPGPLLLGDGQFFSSGRQELVFATSMSFRLQVSTEGPHAPFPDAFSFFLLDAVQRPFATTDPSGADALLVVSISGPEPGIEVFESAFAGIGVGGDLTITDIRARPDVLWPPNGKMVPVDIEVEISTGGDAVQVCAIDQVTSNEEPIDGDFNITGPLALELRARRHGDGNGRVYSVEVVCQGGSRAVAEISVPHNQTAAGL